MRYSLTQKCEKLDSTNYKPISLLSNISKLYEKAMHIQKINFLKKNEILFSYQFGFQKNYSTNYSLISLTEMTRNTHDNGNFACGIFIEMKIDFGTVSHYIFFPR